MYIHIHTPAVVRRISVGVVPTQSWSSKSSCTAGKTDERRSNWLAV